MRIYQTILVIALSSFLVACVAKKQPQLPLGNLTIGVTQFTQPQNPSEMLAGYMSESTERIPAGLLSTLDKQLATELSRESKNRFVSLDKAEYCSKVILRQKNGPKAALQKWTAVGRCMNVDILLVPQALEWQERNGGSLGVVSPARVVLDFFVINVRDESLISRSHVDETQTSLSSNLLEAGKFFKYGGTWVTALELSKESMKTAIKDLGL